MQCSFVEHRNYKVIYMLYMFQFFLVGVGSDELTCGIAGYDYQSVRRWTTFKRLGYGLVECEKNL